MHSEQIILQLINGRRKQMCFCAKNNELRENYPFRVDSLIIMTAGLNTKTQLLNQVCKNRPYINR